MSLLRRFATLLVPAFLILTPDASAQDAFPPIPLAAAAEPLMVDVLSGPAEIMMSARVTDDLSGVKLVSFLVINPIFQVQETCNAERTSGDELDGVYECVLTIPESSGLGEWKISLLATDEVDNPIVILSPALGLLGEFCIPTDPPAPIPQTGCEAKIIVTGLNLPPSLQPDSYVTDEDTELVTDASTGVLANDSDDGGTMEAMLVSDPENGAVNLVADGTFTYLPNEHFFGVDRFQYQASDGTVLSDTVDVDITVNAVNDIPVARDTTITIGEDAPTTFPLPASDIEGDALTFSVVTGPDSGTVSISGNRLTYTPSSGFSGTDSLSFTAADADVSEPAKVILTVSGVNDLPFAQEDAYQAIEDEVLQVAPESGILANDQDGDGDTLEAILVRNPSKGEVSLAADGSFSFMPELNYYGTDSFSYRATDGIANSAETTVTITVGPENDAPIVFGLSLTVQEGASAEVALVASDVEGDTIEFRLDAAPENGTVTLTGNVARYAPASGFSGSDRFGYTAWDGASLSEPGWVDVSVGGVNSAPVAEADRFVLREDEPLNVVASAGVLANDFDPEADTLSATLVARPNHGTLVLASDGSFRYTPDADYFGGDRFRYQASDGDRSSADTEVALEIQPVNDAPGHASLISPANATTLVVSGDPTRVLQVLWSEAQDAEGDPVQYQWELLWNSTILLQSPVGSDTQASFEYGALAAALTQAGATTGEVVHLRHHVVTTDGSARRVGPDHELTVFRGAITHSQDEAEVPEVLFLGPNYPNPFNPETRLRIGIPTAGRVTLSVHDLVGRIVAIPIDRTLSAGWHTIQFSASDLGSGTYLQVLEHDGQRLTRAVILAR